MKFLLPIITAGVLMQAQAAEPSAFGAGDLNSKEPYGLTSTEKEIVKTRDSVKTVKYKSQENSAQLQSLRDRLDGIQTVLEGLSERVQENKTALADVAAEKASAQQRDEKIAALQQSVQASETNIDAMKTLLQGLAAQVDTINANYVSKDEYNQLVEQVNAFKKDVSKLFKKGSSTKSSGYDKVSSKALAADAKKEYDSLYFNAAIPKYEELIRRNYKPAYAHFMIGEMWHYRKNWSKALSYYKESADRYSKASYMPTLMLHSAECMKHLGDIANAKKFLTALAAKYPGTAEAKKAEALLNTL
jgi:TolA-binding protein